MVHSCDNIHGYPSRSAPAPALFWFTLLYSSPGNYYMVFPKSSYTVDLLIFPTRTLVAIHGIKFHASQVFFSFYACCIMHCSTSIPQIGTICSTCITLSLINCHGYNFQILPEKYCYHRKVEDNTNQPIDCVICMTTIDLTQRTSEYMVIMKSCCLWL